MKDEHIEENKDTQALDDADVSEIIKIIDDNNRKSSKNTGDSGVIGLMKMIYFSYIAIMLIILAFVSIENVIKKNRKETIPQIEHKEEFDWDAYYEEQYEKGVAAYEQSNINDAKRYFENAHRLQDTDEYLDVIRKLNTFDGYYRDKKFPYSTADGYEKLLDGEIPIPSSYQEKIKEVTDVYNKYSPIINYDWYLEKDPATHYKDSGYRSTDQYLSIDVLGEVSFVWKRGKGQSGITNKYTIIYEGTGKIKDNQYEFEIIYDDDEPGNVGKKFWVKIEKIKVDYDYYNSEENKRIFEKIDEYKISVVNEKDKKYFYTSYNFIGNRRYRDEKREYSSYPWPADIDVIQHESSNHYSSSNNNKKEYEGEWKDFDDFYDDTWGDYEDEDEAYEEWDRMYN